MAERRLAGALALCCLSVGAVAGAQGVPSRPNGSAAEHRRERVAAVAALHRSIGRPDLAGLQCCSILQIPAAAFAPTSSGVTYQHDGNGYIHALTLSLNDPEFWAPVQLPTGSVVVYLDLYYHDTAPGAGVFAQFFRLHGGTPAEATPGQDFILGAFSADFGGYGVIEAGPISYVIDNDAELSVTGGQYIVGVSMSSNVQELAFKAVDIWYMQQVSPAPASPTFNDVPISDPAFQFIEALAASGITVGCGGGNYCPDAPLTRRQMAVFLAKGFGLYWPY